MNVLRPLGHRSTRIMKIMKIMKEDHENKRVKLHYVGYSNKCDVWISSDTVCPIVKSKKLSTVSQKSYEDRLNSFLDKCRNEIKKHLQIHRVVDPDERVEVSGDADLFQEFFSSCAMKVNHGRTYHYPNNYRDLDHLLGAHWDKRIVNKAGDYAYIVPGQLSIYVSRKKDIVEYSHLPNCRGGGKLRF